MLPPSVSFCRYIDKSVASNESAFLSKLLLHTHTFRAACVPIGLAYADLMGVGVFVIRGTSRQVP